MHVRPLGAAASQDLAILIVRNRGSSACSVSGYPALRASGVRHGVAGPIPLAVRDGSNYFRADPGPHTVILTAGHAASAALETATGWASSPDDMDLITRLNVELPGTHCWLSAPVSRNLPGTGPRWRDVLIVTAFVRGRNGPG